MIALSDLIEKFCETSSSFSSSKVLNMELARAVSKLAIGLLVQNALKKILINIKNRPDTDFRNPWVEFDEKTFRKGGLKFKPVVSQTYSFTDFTSQTEKLFPLQKRKIIKSKKGKIKWRVKVDEKLREKLKKWIWQKEKFYGVNIKTGIACINATVFVLNFSNVTKKVEWKFFRYFFSR